MMQVHTSSTGILWPFLLESCTPGQGGTSQYIPICTTAWLSMLYYIAGCTCLNHVMAPSAYNWLCEACSGLYQVVRICTGTYWTVTVTWTASDIYQYLLICTSMYWYVLLCTSMEYGILPGRQTVLYTRLWGNSVKPQRYVLVYWYILVCSMYW